MVPTEIPPGDCNIRLTKNHMSQHEITVQALCKRILKARLFRGFYIERRYVDSVKGYRDIVALQKSEGELHKALLDVHFRVLQFYLHHPSPPQWFGLSFTKLQDAPVQNGAMHTYIWTELTELAYGQYWFSIRTLRFRGQEVLLKLKMVRSAENEGCGTILKRQILAVNNKADMSDEVSANVQLQDNETSSNETSDMALPEPPINVGEFVELLQSWGDSIKRSVYNFMYNDINKQNIFGFLRFLGLLLFSIVTGGMCVLQNLGTFTICFTYELSRLTHVLTPVIIKVIEMMGKIVGGFYLLLTMIWRDIVGSLLDRQRPVPQAYKSIEYRVHTEQTVQRQRGLPPARFSSVSAAQYSAGFGRKFPM